MAFSRRADEEGLTQVAKLLRAAAEAETIHALNHLRVLGAVKSTAENLDTAISGETFEFQKMYSKYIGIARKEKNNPATWSFDVANKVEEIHANLFSKAMADLKQKKELPETDYYVCSICGNTVEGNAPEKCQICGAPKTKFFKIV